MEGNCLRCGKPFKGKRSDSKYCTDSCKAKSWEEKNKHKHKSIKLKKEGISDKFKEPVDQNLGNLPPLDNLIGNKETEPPKQQKPLIDEKKESEEIMSPGPSMYITKIVKEPNPGYVSCSRQLIELRKDIEGLFKNNTTLDKYIAQEQKAYWNNVWPDPEKAKWHKNNFERGKRLKAECQRLIPLKREREKQLVEELKHHPPFFEKEIQEINPFYRFLQSIKKNNNPDKIEDKKENMTQEIKNDPEKDDSENLPDEFDQDANTNKSSDENSSENPDQYETDKIISMKNLGKREIVKLNFNGKWESFLGKPQPNFCCVVYGMSGQGKSHLAMLFGKYLAERFGRVLYISGEEGFQASFLDKVEKLGVKIDRYYASELHSAQEILEHVPNQYHFIILDSVNNLHIDPAMLKAIQQKFPKSGIVALCQCVKDGKIRGSYQLVHDGNILIRVDKGKAYTEKNRFGQIDTVFNVWEVYEKTSKDAKKKKDPGLDDEFDNTVK